MPVKRFPRRRPRRRMLPYRPKYKKKVPRSIVPKSYLFKRSIQETIVLNCNTPRTDAFTEVDNGIAKHYIHTLNQLHDYTDFTNLFSMYKIHGVATKVYCSTTQAGSGSALGAGLQLQLMRTRYRTGQGAIALYTQNKFLDTQAAKTNTIIRANGKPLSWYTPCNQLSETFESAISSSYGVVRPRWISTAEVNTPHYTDTVRIQLVNDQDLTTWTSGSTQISCKFVHTFYFSMRKVE